VLSGTRDDGAAGQAVIKSSGGAAIVQDPAEALYPGMPSSALANVVVDAVVPSEEIAEAISSMVNGQESSAPQPPVQPGRDPQGDHLTSVCPECGGVLSERIEAGMPESKCHVGHRDSPTSLADAQGDRVEMALWAAARMLRDRSAPTERMADQSQERGQRRSAHRFREQADDASRQADLVREARSRAAAGVIPNGDADDVLGAEGTSA
jgi:two-component system chemotaxis response regulator CheB